MLTRQLRLRTGLQFLSPGTLRYREQTALASGKQTRSRRATPSRGPQKSWTLMVYMAGDNSLDAEGIPDLTEMKKVGWTADINLVAQLDRATGHAAKRLKRKLDVAGMDACVMSMAEVGYQIHENAAFAVGSEETEPGGGWSYDTILAALAKQPSMGPAEFSTLVVEKYLAAYPRDSGTYAGCDLAKADALATAVGHLAGALTASLSDPGT